MAAAPHAYEFGPYRLDMPTRRLLRGEDLIPLSPKAFDTLQALIERRDRVVDKAELFKLVWHDAFVEEANLSQTIFVLRKALGGDGGDGHPFIETVPRRGYRFVAGVREIAAGSAGLSRVEGRARLLWAIGVVAGILVVLVGGLVRSRGASHSPSDRRIMLAVLPFDDLGGDPAQDYFSNGLTEEMITRLGSLDPDHLGVIARASAMQYKGTRKDVRQIGTALGVDYLLEGSVRRDRDRVRIAAQLVLVRDQSQVWAADYDRELRDVLTVQADVARRVAQQIELRLRPDQSATVRSARALNPDAFEQYLKGRFFWNKRTPDGYQRALEHFDAAQRLDPTYAPTYAGLADTYALLASAVNTVLPRAEAMARAREAADRAIALDDALADPHTSLGFVKMHYDWDFAGAEREFRRAIALNGGYATAHHWYAYDLVALGRFQDAVAEIGLAEKADPLSVIINRDVCEILLFAGRNDEAIAQCRQTLDMDPSFGLAHWTLSWAYEYAGRHAEAIDELAKSAQFGSPGAAATLEVRTGRLADARKHLRSLLQENASRYGLDMEIAWLSLALGDRERAFRALDHAFHERDGAFIVIAVSPEWRDAREDPQLTALVRRAGVVAPPGAAGGSGKS